VTKEFWRARFFAHSSTTEVLRFSWSMFRSWLAEIGALYPERLAMLLAFLGGVTLLRVTERPHRQHDAHVVTNRPLANLCMIMLGLTAYVMGAGVFYATHFLDTRRWYFGGARVLWVIAVLAGCAFALEAHGRTAPRILRIVTAIVLVIIAVSAARSASGYSFGEPSGPGKFIEAAHFLNANLPHDAVIAAYSSGILSYFAERRVINLDGLANNEIVDIARRRAMDKYLDARGVRYLADYEAIVRPRGVVGLQIDGDPGYLTRLKELYRVSDTSELGDILVWEVMPPNAKEAR
jgi:hypothetical protein